MFLRLLGLILVTSLQGVCSQKIVSFTSFINGSCTEPNVAREHLDKFFIHAILHLELANAQDWWAFVLQSPNDRFNETIALVRVDDCEPGIPPSYNKMLPDTSICWKHGKDVHALFALGVSPKYNQSFFSGVWSKESSGSIMTDPPYIKLTTVVPDDERVEVNGIALAHNAKHMTFHVGVLTSIRYCVLNVKEHHMYVTFNEVKETSVEDCVMLNTTLRDFDVGKTIEVGLVETAGMCKRVLHHTYTAEIGFTNEAPKEDVKLTLRSTNGANRMVMAPFEYFSLVTAVWAVSMLY